MRINLFLPGLRIEAQKIEYFHMTIDEIESIFRLTFIKEKIVRNFFTYLSA